jgi:WD40 repeat protein
MPGIKVRGVFVFFFDFALTLEWVDVFIAQYGATHTSFCRKHKAHDNVIMGCEWHPHETSKVFTCSWDGTIKLWD